MFPSFGILSVLAALCLVGGLVFAYSESNAMGTGFLAATAVAVPAAMLFGFKILPKSPMAKHLMAEGYSFEGGDVSDPRDNDLMGQEGEVLSMLRPAGTARLEGRRVDVMSRGEVIEAGERVRVIELRGNQVVVARAQAPEPS